MSDGDSSQNIALRDSNGIFSKMYDNRAVVQFVREIEKHPCLYDQKSPNYLNRALKTKIWNQVARKCQCTVAECKEKWRKIRVAYIRTLKPSYNTGSSRPYYLSPYLKFIAPHYKNDTSDSLNESKDEQEENASAKEDDTEDVADIITINQDAIIKHEVFENEEHISFCESVESFDEYNENEIKEATTSIANETNEIKEFKDSSSTNCCDSRKSVKRKCPCNSLECNPRKMFLLSLLPDIESLSEEKMRIFRREVIDLVDKVILQ